ncbi:metallophosphoesterase family protein [Desulfatitalea alkaliphila]|uniref:Metallophosphoesterase family protein n=1 Tax=Desulfatitalea alkaliphila TaxID=2929485 RepID=A0AA41R506_9BACT|nr:metallophosphoesterase [Desulfatitalea alkaliphila]MCJ8501065.1 metallophosphoesterase family protein [Desulfatitalea alkaliphila]
MMRLLAVADLHAKPERLIRLAEAVARHRPDLLVVAGDICNFLRPRPVYARLDALGLPVLTVRGNTDRAWHDRILKDYHRIQSLHKRTVTFQGCPFVGISGTLPLPFRTRLGLFEDKWITSVAPLITPHTILVTHPPPFGTHDRVLGRHSAGSRGVARLIRQTRPRLLLCGHIHEDPGTTRIGSTLVVNCNVAGGTGAVIDMDPQGISATTVRDVD